MCAPRLRRRLLLTICVVVGALLSGIEAAGPALQRTPPLAGFAVLGDLVAAVPDLNKGQKNSLLAKISVAEQSYGRGQVCASVHQIGAFAREVQALRHGARTRYAERLFNEARTLLDLLQLPPNPCADARIGLLPAIQIARSDNQQFEAAIRFGRPHLQTLQDGGEVWTRLTIPGTEEGGDGNGHPALPVFRRLIGVPRGAQAEIALMRLQVAESFSANLYPYQPFRQEMSTEIDTFHDRLPPPELYAEQPFFKDARAYEQNQVMPSQPCRIRRAGRMRDLELAAIECAAGAYNPVRAAVTLYSRIDLRVTFRGASADAAFLTTDAMSPFEPGGLYQDAVVNHAALLRYLSPLVRAVRCVGEELLILTHPTYRPAALALAAWKQQRGIVTSVIDVNDGAGSGPDTNAEIDAYIDDRYRHCSVRPAYILLLGDSADIATWVIQRLDKDEGVMVATDFPYATFDEAPDALVATPSFAVSRIPVQSLEQAQVVVDKIIGYESLPPPSPLAGAFYREATVASYHQCCRTDVMGAPGVENGRRFMMNAEFLRDQLRGRGYAVDRIYNTNTNYHPEYMLDPTPLAFANQTPLPDELLPSSGFMWPGAAADITAAFNAGRSLFFHVDHGGTSGWGDPSFNTGHLSGLSNGALLPVVFNLNCSSGNFEQSSFSERILRLAGGGAVGVSGWTRMSNTLYYRAVIEGTLDALWPDTLPSFGGNTTEHRRLGDLFNHSRLYMATVHGGLAPGDAGFNNAINHVRLYHAFGDPTLDIWTSEPFHLPQFTAIDRRPEFLILPYSVDGAIVTVLQQTRAGVLPIGRGVAADGSVRVMYFTAPEAGAPLMVTATLPNAVGVTAIFE